ncbi:MAG: hypothetical protein TREMPRED_003119 [Tremellales sp. Tagirdzhanova-0007]|nr:MAG: hypothetical protein TREMPRED_003119 [Tremellales sp. Tagirdzhanova-0007]
MSRVAPLRPTRTLVPRETTVTAGGLPTASVVSIGGGFVAFALTILVILSIVRISRLVTQARRERLAGQNTTFRQLWKRDGGFWGFFSGLGGESAAGGAGFTDLSRQRRWAEMVQRERWMTETMGIESEVEDPKLWEVGVGEKGSHSEEQVDLGRIRPLAAITSERPGPEPDASDESTLKPHSLNPTLSLSLLIELPSYHQHHSRSELGRKGEVGARVSDEYDELPELVIGSTTVIPFIRPPDPRLSVGDSVSAEAIDEKDVVYSDISHLESAVSSSVETRRAVWSRVGDGWIVEGLDTA